jgi:hypothetical protein
MHGALVRSSSGPTSVSNLARDMGTFKCFAPVSSAVMNGRLMSVC